MGDGLDGDDHRVQGFAAFLLKKRPVIGVNPLAAEVLRRCVAPLFHRIGHGHHGHVVHLFKGMDVRLHSAAASNQAKTDLFHNLFLLFQGGFPPPVFSGIIILLELAWVNLIILINYKDIARCLLKFEESI